MNEGTVVRLFNIIAQCRIESHRVYLRPENENAETVERRAELDRQVEGLRQSLHTLQLPESARASLDLAAILCWRGQYRQTLEILQPLLGADLPTGMFLEVRQLIADNHFRHDQYDIAKSAYQENLERAQQAGEDYWVARARDGMAWVLVDVGHYTSGEFEEAGRIFEENLPIHALHGSWVAEAMGIYGLSRAAAGMGEYDRALKLAYDSIAFLEKHGGHHLVQLPLLQIANVHRDRGSFAQARPFYDRAVDAADQSQDPYLQVLTAYHYGCLLLFEGEETAAADLWRIALPWIAELEFPRLGSETCGKLAQLAAKNGDFEGAYRLQMESQQYGNRVGVISTILQNQRMILRSAMDRARRLEEELTYLTAGVEASEDGIIVLEIPKTGDASSEFLIQFANEAAAQIFGKTPSSISKVMLGSVWQSTTSGELLEYSQKVYLTGERHTLDPISLAFRDGKARWFAVKIAKVPGGIAWTLSDVSERETMRQQILAQRDRLEEANSRLTTLDREKSEMLSIAAHDLRSPIGNIRSLCELISSDASRTTELAEMIRFSADSLLALIADLLDVERIEQGQFKLEFRPVDVSLIADRIIRQASAEASQKHMTIQLEGSRLLLLADENAMVRVIQNLVSNAIKFSPLGTSIAICTCLNGGVGRMEIRDQGPGVTEQDQRKLFTKFAHLSARPTAGKSSTGLGLSIVKQLIEAMNGRVGCDSVAGQGATFWFELPAVDSIPSQIDR